MPPKASSLYRFGRTRLTARKSTGDAKSTAQKSSPPPEPDRIVQKDSQLTSNSTNFEISEHPETSQVPAANTGETTVVELISTDEAEQVTPAKAVEIEPVGEQKVGKKKLVKRIVKKIVKKKVLKSVAKASGLIPEDADAEAVLDSLDVEKASCGGTIQPASEDLEPTSAATVGDSEKGTITAEVMLGKDVIKDCEVSLTEDKLEPPISDAKDNLGGSLESGSVVPDPEKGNPRSAKIVKKIVKKKVPKLISKNSGKTEESEGGRENADTGTVLDSFGVEKDSSRGKIESETEHLEPTSAATADDSEKGNSHPVEAGKGTIVAEGILGKDEMRDCEVSVIEDKLELPISECKDAKDNIGSLESGNIVLDSEKGNLPSLKVVKKIVKKKVPKLVARKSGKREELVKGSKNEVAENILDSEGVEKSKPNSSGTENLESGKAVSAKSEESMNLSLHLMDVEKATSASEFGATENTLVPSILDHKDTNVIENDNMDSLETQTVVLDSEKRSLDVSTSHNVDSSKDQNLGQLGEEGYSQGTEETKEAVDTSLRLNEGILLSGEMEALERKKRRRTEIFIGGLDKESKEDDLRRIFGEVGEIVELRLMKNRETGKNKGFAFVRYASAADAKKAVERYSKVEISGKQCGVSLVEGKDTIYLGNIDKKWKTEDLIELLKKAGIENIDKVTVMANPNNTKQNRGFAFVELETSKDAQVAFSKLNKKDAFGKHVKVKVAWAQPLIEPNEEELLKVKAVYAEYLPSSWNEEKVRDYFGKFGEIESIVLAKDLPSSRRKDFAFVNYISRESALACIEAFSHVPANDSGSKVNMKVSLAKPMPKSKQTKRLTVPTKREPREEKKIQGQSILKRHESSKMVNYMRRYDEGHRVDGGSSTTSELLHLLRQQGPACQLHPGLNMGPGINHQYSLSGSKRPFSAVVDNPHRMDSSGVSRVRVERSFPTNQSVLSHSRGPLGTPSFAYYSQQGSGHSPGSVYGVERFPNSFQSQVRGPYGGYHGISRRY
ncbi:nucleolin-like [Capsicum annuum]|uniref:nucleolin-like n=1 Tax=Capsicum annuum TaxID=4072 RepID=UPI001FB0EF5B|nr:nucleolin-like [Capsicum annuum]